MKDRPERVKAASTPRSTLTAAVRNSPSRSLKLEDEEVERALASGDEQQSSASHESATGEEHAHINAEVGACICTSPLSAFEAESAAMSSCHVAMLGLLGMLSSRSVSSLSPLHATLYLARQARMHRACWIFGLYCSVSLRPRVSSALHR